MRVPLLVLLMTVAAPVISQEIRSPFNGLILPEDGAGSGFSFVLIGHVYGRSGFPASSSMRRRISQPCLLSPFRLGRR